MKTKIVGLTGGIGSGKSTVAKMFEALKVPVYYADDEAKQLMVTSEKVKSELINKFGEKTYKEGALNRAYLADIVFSDKEALANINRIVHPEVYRHFRLWVNRQEYPYVIQENAIIFEQQNENRFDIIILVTAPKNDRIDRILKRDNATLTKVNDRMNNQLPDEIKIPKSDFVINNVDLHQTEQKVLKIHQVLLNKD